MKVALILAGPIGLAALFLIAYCASGCTLKEDCNDCQVHVEVPNLPTCLLYDVDSGTIELCPVDAGTDAGDQ